MHSFDKKISKKLSDAPSVLPDQEVWRQVEERLVSSNRFARYWKKGAMTALLISLLTIGSFLVGRHSATKVVTKQVDLLENSPITQFDKTAAPEMQQMIVRDTVVQYVYIDRSKESQTPSKHVSDELTRTLGKSTLLSNSPFLENRTLNSLASDTTPWTSSYPIDVFHLSAARSTLGGSKLAQHTSRNALLGETRPEYNSVDFISTHFTPNVQSLARETVPRISLPPRYAMDIENIIRIEKRERILQKLWPDQVSAGLETGAFYPITEETSDAQEVIFGVHTSLHFSTNFSLMSGLRYRTLSIKHEHDIDEIPFPLPNDLRAGDELHEVYVNNQSVDIPFVLKYSFSNERRIFPYAKVGLLLSSTRKQKYTYEIIRNNDEIKTSVKGPSTPWILGSFIGGLGAGYDVSSRLSVGLDVEGRYHYRTRSMASIRHHALGLRLNLHYHL